MARAHLRLAEHQRPEVPSLAKRLEDGFAEAGAGGGAARVGGDHLLHVGQHAGPVDLEAVERHGDIALVVLQEVGKPVGEFDGGMAVAARLPPRPDQHLVTDAVELPEYDFVGNVEHRLNSGLKILAL